MCSWGPRPSLHRPPGLAGAPALTCPLDCSVISLCSATSRLGTSHPVPRPWSGSQCPPCRCQSCPCLCPRLVPTSTLSGAAESSRPTCVPAQPEAPAPGTRRPSGDAHCQPHAASSLPCGRSRCWLWLPVLAVLSASRLSPPHRCRSCARAAHGLPRAPSWRSSHWPPVSLCAQASAWRILSEGGRTGPSVPCGSSARRLRRPLSLLIRVVCEASGVCSASLSSVSSARFEPVLNFATAARDETRLRTGGGDRDSGKGRGRLTVPLGAFGDACLLASNPQFRLYVSLCFLALFSHFLSNKKLGEKLQVQYKILPRTI